eukprot:CAMPEP_0198429272 /NCGR_PEP_ID=MMETSP1452-20131203/7075_1 /TAXON_ID=1181717 /ORGANISM="Synchroma pusillum, Strain CCMP3072" /LENGTH=446 /DNA_ID=CAMNT_0044149677 /DNA_START=51 /DNA_END=1388 /DNA_ORIENTATION=+
MATESEATKRPVSRRELLRRDLARGIPVLRMEEEGFTDFGDVLGRGAFGFVASGMYRGHKVAVKTLRSEERTSREAFDREARVHAALCFHAPAVVVQLYGLSSNGLQLVMERASHTLKHLLHPQQQPPPRPPSLPEVLQLHATVATALHDVHAVGVAHGDLKPSNVFLFGEPGSFLAKLGDLGLVHVAGEPLKRQGTLPYMAPELVPEDAGSAEGSSPEALSALDMYSFGVMLNEAITGKKPWRESTDREVISSVVAERRPPLLSEKDCPELDAAVLSDLQNLVTACWHQSPGERPSAAHAAEQLRAMLVRAYGDPTELAAFLHSLCRNLTCLAAESAARGVIRAWQVHSKAELETFWDQNRAHLHDTDLANVMAIQLQHATHIFDGLERAAEDRAALEYLATVQSLADLIHGLCGNLAPEEARAAAERAAAGGVKSVARLQLLWQ